ncbi:MAG TPA: GDSL-type esterase/lipase family protein [Candidatus Acidoferrum sp.]|nr:GDSL-type esterase/lipase family protein [Candidatus Acidoferrum sp.]
MNNKKTIFALGAVIMIMVSYMAGFQIINAQFVELPHKLVRVACVGDSITQASGYPAKLQLLLGTDYFVGNFGVSGSTVSLNSTRPYMNQTAFQKAENFKPNVVVIMLGTNDARTDLSQYNKTFEATYDQLVSSFQNLESNPQIFVVDSPPIFTNNPDYNNTYLVNNVIPQIDNVANNLSLPAVDIYDAFTNHSDYFMDGIHPNIEGTALIASEVDNAIISQEPSIP